MRPILLMFLLACGAPGCAAPTEPATGTQSAAPQPKPGTVSARMGGEFGWYGTMGSKSR